MTDRIRLTKIDENEKPVWECDGLYIEDEQDFKLVGEKTVVTSNEIREFIRQHSADSSIKDQSRIRETIRDTGKNHEDGYPSLFGIAS